MSAFIRLLLNLAFLTAPLSAKDAAKKQSASKSADEESGAADEGKSAKEDKDKKPEVKAKETKGGLVYFVFTARQHLVPVWIWLLLFR